MRWAAALRMGVLVGAAIGLAGAGVLWLGGLRWVALAVAGLVVLVAIWRGTVAGRLRRATAYAESSDELWVRNGLLVRTVAVVPYGRLQSAVVTDGPWLRRYGLANVSITTAGMGGSSEVKGLTRMDAEALMGRLVERAKTLQWTQ
ncbi:PH domain-containing protein [Epidermidibacterium keratini]|uniref:PH domain-containing protein n=1 Tax=Epidermidibacterium keratini TaxID=1891644 RepID=A0A7L4YJR6_9ACTN|nr:PH domain-containing protein [Epidermidibacterium keratini]QHB99514.1 PH domain-containing protein [Epidermidibacterium keratini]